LELALLTPDTFAFKLIVEPEQNVKSEPKSTLSLPQFGCAKTKLLRQKNIKKSLINFNFILENNSQIYTFFIEI
jgi:hypothetical protein